MALAQIAARFEEVLGRDCSPVAVFLLGPDDDLGSFAEWRPLQGHRYCQALMRARRGEAVTLDARGLACPAAAAAFGLRPLPAQLANGKGLVGFGIVTEEDSGRAMFEGMSKLPEGSVHLLALAPLRLAPRLPDVVVVEGPAESLMWLLLADLNVARGARRRSDTAVLQATCVDATVIPHLEKRLNYSLGCYGCREATDLAPSETVLGFPGERLEPLAAALGRLAERAVPRSRAKSAFHSLVAGRP